jgi:RNA recognition motif-containing protein
MHPPRETYRRSIPEHGSARGSSHEALQFLSSLEAFAEPPSHTPYKRLREEEPVTLFVSNVAYEAREIELKEYFAQHVPVLDLRLQEKRDHRTGVRLCFALLTLYSRIDAEFVLRRFDRSEFMGRRLRLRFSQQDRSRPPRVRRPAPAIIEPPVGRNAWAASALSVN